MIREVDRDNSRIGWQRRYSVASSDAKSAATDNEIAPRNPTLLGEVLQTGATLARGLGYVAREGYRALREEKAERSRQKQQVVAPANKPGHSSDLVLSVPPRETRYAPWKGTVTERLHRAAGFVGWALDGTRAPQAKELRYLHEAEQIDRATKQLFSAVVRRAGEALATDPFETNAKFPLQTRLDMHVATDEETVLLEVTGPGLAGEYDATYSTLILHPPTPEGVPTPPQFFRLDDTGQVLADLRPATLAEVNVFLSDLNE